ncbi:MAG: hypothetical protein WD098_03435 [Balneolales bacterium]
MFYLPSNPLVNLADVDTATVTVMDQGHEPASVLVHGHFYCSGDMSGIRTFTMRRTLIGFPSWFIEMIKADST